MKKHFIRSKEDLGKFLRELRAGSGLRQTDFGCLLRGDSDDPHAAQQRVSRWEQGNNAPPLDELLRICDLLGYDVVLQPKPKQLRRAA